MSSVVITVRVNELLYRNVVALAEAENTTAAKVVIGCIQARIAVELANRLETDFAALVSSGRLVKEKREEKRRLAEAYATNGGDVSKGKELWDKYPLV
jgi:hypothetical protein